MEFDIVIRNERKETNDEKISLLRYTPRRGIYGNKSGRQGDLPVPAWRICRQVGRVETMNTLDILIRICEKREDLVVNGLNAQDALTKATQAIAEEYHICSASISKLVTL